MAGLFVAVRHTPGTGTPGSVAGAWKGIFSLTAASNHRIRIAKMTLMTPAGASDDTGMRFRLVTGTGSFTPNGATGGGTATAELVDLSASESIQTTVEQGSTVTNANTAELTVTNVLYETAFKTNAGSWNWNGSLYVPGGTEVVGQVLQETDTNSTPFYVLIEE